MAPIPKTRDASWVAASFMVGNSELIEADRAFRDFTTASLKFTDTRLGGNFSINNPPQYTRFADIRSIGRYAGNQTKNSLGNAYGQGRFYSEQMDDNGQLIHMRFGVASYNGLLTFFHGFYNADSGFEARTGRGLLSGYGVGRVIGFVVSLYAWPVLVGGAIFRFLTMSPSSKYYYFKPTMYPYWNRVNTIANSIGVNMGIIARAYTFDEDAKLDGEVAKEDVAQRARFYSMAKDIFHRNGGLDIYAVANRAQRLSVMHRQNLKQIMENFNGSNEEWNQEVARVGSEVLGTGYNDKDHTLLGNDDVTPQQMLNDMNNYGTTDNPVVGNSAVSGNPQLRAYHESMSMGGVPPKSTGSNSKQLAEADAAFVERGYRGEWVVSPDASGNGQTSRILDPYYGNADPDNNSKWRESLEATNRRLAGTETSATDDAALVGDATVDMNKIGIAPEDIGSDSFLKRLANNLLADHQEGSQFVTFRVDYTGTVEESFQNMSKETVISSKLNGFAAGARDLRMSTSDGNTGINIVDFVTNGIREVATGIAASLEMSGLIGLTGTSFIDFPKQWDNSTATFPRSNYTIQLRSPYGNPMARYLNLMVPLSMLLAAALPISTGKRSYTSPYLLELYSKGRNQIRLGMIDSLSVTRGTGNIGWTKDGHPLGIDINLSIVDFSTVMHAPIRAQYSFMNPFDGLLDDDNAFSDYMATLGSLTMAEQIYASRRLMLNITKRWVQFRSNFSTAKATNMFFNDTLVGEALQAFALAGQRTLGR